MSAADVLCTLNAAGRAAADYRSGADLPRTVAPRPYLHPVRTPGGTVVTAVAPPDHVHHLGFSLAIADFGGVSFWGGRMFVRGAGPTWLDNHGSQHGTALVPSPPASPTRLCDTVAWNGPGGELLATEDREIEVDDAATRTTVRWRSTLRPTHPTRIGSPAVNGKPGAGYGGLFWRFPSWDDVRVCVTEGEGTDAAHGSTSPWLAISGTDGAHGASVVLVEPGPEPALPWFVRAEGKYVGAGPALAWEHARDLAAGEPLTCALDALVLDGVLEGPEHAAALVAQHRPTRATAG